MHSWWAQSNKRGELEKRSEWLRLWNVRDVVVCAATDKEPAQLCWFDMRGQPFGSFVLDTGVEVRVVDGARLVVKTGPDVEPKRELHFRLKGGARSPSSAPNSLQTWCDAVEDAARPQNAAEAVATAGVRLVSLAAPSAARSLASWLGLRRRSAVPEEPGEEEAAPGLEPSAGSTAARGRRVSTGLRRRRQPPEDAEGLQAVPLEAASSPPATRGFGTPKMREEGAAAAPAAGKLKGKPRIASLVRPNAAARAESPVRAAGSAPPAAPATTTGVRSVCARPRYWSNRAAKKSVGWSAERLTHPPLLAALEEALRVADASSLTKGRDVREGGKYTRLGLAAAWRVENPMVWDRYAVERAAMLSLASLARFPAVELRSEIVQATSRLEESAPAGALHAPVNEAWLLHGTRPETVVPIMSGGMNERFSDGHFGSGSYLAEVSDKINQYVVCENSCRSGGPLDELHALLYGEGCPRPSNVFYAFVCRALLGYPVRTKDGANDLDAEAKAPIFAPGSDRRELAAVPAETGLPPGTRYHSIVVETGGKVKRHREFVVFRSERIYPEYLVAFHRLP